MTETKLLTELEIEAWGVDEPPADFTARVLEGLDADDDGLDAEDAPMRIASGVAAPVAPRRWPRIAATALGVAAAAGLVLWLSGPDVATSGADGHEHAASRVAEEETAGGRASDGASQAERRDPPIASPETPEALEAPEAPVAPAVSKVSKAAAPEAPPVPEAPPAPPPPSNDEAPAEAPPAPAPSSPTPPASAPEAPKAPTAPPSPAPATATAMGLRVRADASTRYVLHCTFGDARVSLVRDGNLDIDTAEEDGEEGLVLEGGELFFRTSKPIACTLERRRGGRIDVVLRTRRGETRGTLEGKKGKIHFGL